MRVLKTTPLNAIHRASGARMVDFGGWDMPLHYGSQIDEHHAVSTDAGMFDVSHMRVVDLHGDGDPSPRAFLRYALANNADKLKAPGKALYSCLLRDDGGVLDDLIVYYLREDFFRLVVNAATADKDIAWLRPDGQQMSDEDWTVGFARSVAIFLNGKGIPEHDDVGEQIVDDSFLLLINAHHQQMTFTLPDEAYGHTWQIVIDTADPLLAHARRRNAVPKGRLRVPARAMLVNYLREFKINSGIPKYQAYNITMYIMAGLLIVAFFANLAVKPVSERLTEREPQPGGRPVTV